MDFLSGKKTYIVALLMGIGAFAVQMGWITEDFLAEVKNYLVAMGLITLRAAVAKVGE